MRSVFGVFLLGWIFSVGCVPFPEGVSAEVGFISKGTHEIARALLQGYMEKEENMVYSPLGYSAIFAVFSEGARGRSREEIVNALYFPSDVTVLREGFRSVLERFAENKCLNSPEFQNWFYVYKNYTIEGELQNILRKYYLTDVRSVDKPQDYVKDRKNPVKQTTTGPKTDEVIKEQAAEKVKIVEPGNAPYSAKTAEKSLRTVKGGANVTENSKYKGEEDIAQSEGENKNKLMEEEKIKKDVAVTPIKTNTAMGPMQFEHFSGITDSSLSIRGLEPEPKMIIFNGLYYKGEWKMPFVKEPAHNSRVFYKSEKEKISVSTLHSQGVFKYGDILNLDCKAIELPYKGGRYSLLVLVPNARNGLNKLISNLSGYPFSNIYDQLSEKLLEVCLPSFEIYTISKPVSAKTKLGLKKVKSIFNPETADLSGISSKDSGLYIEELVQVVTFKVDADYSRANFLTASNAASRSNVQTFQINQPFLFYLRDTLEDLIIVNGKVIDPTPRTNLYFS